MNEDLCKKCHHALEKPHFSSIIYLINVNNRIEKHFIELVSNELFFYKDESKKECTKILILDSYFFFERDPIFFEGLNQVFPFEFRSRNSFLYFCMPSENIRNKFKEAISSFLNFRPIYDFYDMKEQIGKGAYSKVFRGKHKTKKFECAIKVILKDKMSSSELEILMNEIEILRILKHPNILNLIDYFETFDKIFLVLEFLKGGEVEDYIQANKRTLTEDKVRSIIHSLATALYFIHYYGIIHRDLKPQNIIKIDKSSFSDVKISDFGLSKIYVPNSKCTESYGTLAYVSPEVLNEDPYDYNADIWSLGIIMYYMLSGTIPFDSTRDDEIALKILKGTPDLSFYYKEKKMSKESITLIEKMLIKDPKKRIQIEEILTNNWLLKDNQELLTLRRNANELEKFKLFSLTDPMNINAFTEGINLR